MRGWGEQPARVNVCESILLLCMCGTEFILLCLRARVGRAVCARVALENKK